MYKKYLVTHPPSPPPLPGGEDGGLPVHQKPDGVDT